LGRLQWLQVIGLRRAEEGSDIKGVEGCALLGGSKAVVELVVAALDPLS